MEIFQTFEEYLGQSSVSIPLVSFILNLIFTGVLTLILRQVYIRYGNALSNRKLFGRNFLMIGMTTMLIITIVKSSLALSLGLVGALSIIRFRAAIKEPEELAYLFLAISIGLGFGANQGSITTIALIIILAIIIITKKLVFQDFENNNLHLTIMSEKPEGTILDDIVKLLNKHCSGVNIKRLDESDKVLEVTFSVEFNSYSKLSNIKNDLRELDKGVKVTFLDSQGLI